MEARNGVDSNSSRGLSPGRGGVPTSWLRRPDVVMVAASAPTYVATSELLRAVDPFDLTPLRFLASALVLGAFLLWRQGTAWSARRLSGADRWRVVLVSVVGYGLYGTLLNAGQTTVPAGTTSLLLNSSPLFAMALGFLFLGERVPRRGLVGLVVAVVGTTLVATSGTGELGFDVNALTVLGGALVLAVFLIAQQPLLRRVDPVEMVFWGCLVGGLSTLPLAPLHLDAAAWSERTWVALAALVLVSTVVGYSFWNLSLARTSAAEGGSLLFAVPVLSLLLGWALLGQAPTATAVVGGVLALGGVLVLSRAAASVGPVPAACTLAIPAPSRPADDVAAVSEAVAPLALGEADRAALAEAAERATGLVGAGLVTISLWRPATRDLVRVHTSLPSVYREGGISAHLGDEWVDQCVVRRESYLAESETALSTDAFEHHDTLAQLDLGSAINAVVEHEGAFVGCLNLLDRSGAYSADDLAAVVDVAGGLGPLLASLPAASLPSSSPTTA